MTGRSRVALALVLTSGLAAAAAACARSGADHETLGDRAYVELDFASALVEYRLALRREAPDPDLRAKAGLAALKAGDLPAAAEEYRALAAESGDRVTEAADGLERVARAAAERGNRLALQTALEGLRETASARAVGAFAREVALELANDPQASDALEVIPYAAAVAPNAGLQDSLMFAYGVALVRAGRCERAVAVFESLLRRHREPVVEPDARQRAAACALQLGLRELDRGLPERAEGWFVRAATGEEDSEYARAAYIGVGDVRLARGDYVAAASAYRRAMLGTTPRDSIYRMASERLNALGDAGTVIR